MTVDQKALLERITIKPGLMGGRPTVGGLRFPVGDVLELLASGLSEQEILEEHPVLEKEDIKAALLYASSKLKNTAVIKEWESLNQAKDKSEKTTDKLHLVDMIGAAKGNYNSIGEIDDHIKKTPR